MSKEITENKPKLDIPSSYLAMVAHSVGTEMFRNLYYRIHGENLDVLEDGDLSCAVFVTSIQYLFGLIKEVHTTVKGTIEDMETSGWYHIKKPRKGAVILWDYRKLRGGKLGKNRHIGFYIDENTAISNSSKKRKVWKHHPTYGTDPEGKPKRDILAFYWHPNLG